MGDGADNKGFSPRTGEAIQSTLRSKMALMGDALFFLFTLTFGSNKKDGKVLNK